LTHIDLFSGIGGFAIAAQWAGFKTVAFVEIEPYAQEIIKQNFGAVADAGCQCRGTTRTEPKQDQSISDIHNQRCRPRIYGDIRAFDGTRYRGATLLTGGFPCQPFSQAGKRRGAADDRALWPEMFRVICEVRPTWVVGENVAGFVTMELDNCISDLEREGYAVQPLIIPACAVDARHRRDRVWIAATEIERAGEDVADADTGKQSNVPVNGRSGNGVQEHDRRGYNTWLPEPDVDRVANGVPRRVDRLKGLGNSIVPQVAYEILRVIAEIESVVVKPEE
jgi:DNA (cytosine-5)-methyltransferase 1